MQTLKKCEGCNVDFWILDEDKKYYSEYAVVIGGAKYELPEPTLCVFCRAKKRLVWRNERNLYHRKCDATGKQIISIYSEDKPYKVYSQEYWWSDSWDPTTYGAEFNFGKTFFEQFNELMHRVPHMALIASENENSDFCHLIANCRNCYMIVESSNNEDCMYGYWLQKSTKIVDGAYVNDSQFCYEVDNCNNCYNLRWSSNCNNCSDSYFLEDCTSCKNCIGCKNLVNKEYYIFNKQYSKEEYENIKAGYNFGSFSFVEDFKIKFSQFCESFSNKFAHVLNSENCLGDYISNSRNCYFAFHANEADGCRYAENVWRRSVNNMDVSTAGRNAELIYECCNVGIDSYNIKFSVQCWSSTNLLYSYLCFNCKDCFGCVSLHNKQYCILNKQYTKEEYERLMPMILEYLKQTGEFGQFFPYSVSPFGYNETSAQDKFPLNQEQAHFIGAKWNQTEINANLNVSEYQIPDSISEVTDEILNVVLKCQVSGKNYKIIKEELKFYRDLGVPIPRVNLNVRHLNRAAKQNPSFLWPRNCDKCQIDIHSSYSLDRPEKVYCEKCYLAEVF